jgi:hemolysin activation/secretion protein
VIKSLPDLSRRLPDVPGLRETAGPVLGWLGDTRLALRLFGGTSAPSRGEFFTMGGGELFRGFDLAQRQGSTVWVGSVEWRVPLATRLNLDCCDHVVGLRNVWGAAFYDVGDAYVNNRSVGPVAHAVGAGLRLDVAWFSFVERTMLRLDVAKTVNCDSGVQVWFGIQHPF